MARKQKVVRTYPPGWTHSSELLEQLLEKGWLVKMRTTIVYKDNTTIIEYILEKDE